MKRIIFVFALVFVLSAAVSCNKQSGDPFKVLDCDFTVRISSVCEGTSCVFEYDKKTQSLCFLSPEELSGYVLRLDGNRVLLSYGDVESEVSAYAGRLAFVCKEIFSVDANEINSISAQENEDGTVTSVKTENIEYHFVDDGIPAFVSGYFDGVGFEFTLSDFKVAYGI